MEPKERAANMNCDIIRKLLSVLGDDTHGIELFDRRNS